MSVRHNMEHRDPLSKTTGGMEKKLIKTLLDVVDLEGYDTSEKTKQKAESANARWCNMRHCFCKSRQFEADSD